MQPLNNWPSHIAIFPVKTLVWACKLFVEQQKPKTKGINRQTVAETHFLFRISISISLIY